MSENEIPQSMLARVQRCLDVAKECEARGNEADAKAAFAKADAIMTKYAIDRALVEFAKTDRTTRQEPVRVDIDFPGDGDEFNGPMVQMFSAIVNHNRCRAVVRSYSGSASIVGFPEDVEYTQMLWAGVLLSFASRINPTWDTSKSADENIKVLKEAGRKWPYIAKHANENGFSCTATDGRLKAAYRRQCKAEGVEPTAHTQRNEAYRAAYVEAFSAEIRSRLYRMSRAATEQAEARREPGTALALRSRLDEVWEKFYELFPHLRPVSEEDLERMRRDAAERERLEAERRAKLTPAQRAQEDAQARRAAERDQIRWERERARTNDSAGRSAGRRAAQTVDLGAGKVGSGRKAEIES